MTKTCPHCTNNLYIWPRSADWICQDGARCGHTERTTADELVEYIAYVTKRIVDAKSATEPCSVRIESLTRTLNTAINKHIEHQRTAVAA